MVKMMTALDSNIVEFRIDGTITQEEYDRIATAFEEKIAKHGKVRMLKDVGTFQGFSNLNFGKAIQFSLNHMKDIEKAAVVSDLDWTGPMIKAMKPLIGMEVRQFKRSEIEEARAWLRTDPMFEAAPSISSPGTNTKPGFSWHEDEAGVIELEILGHITKADIQLATSKLREAFSRHEKIRLIEIIRHFEGMDPSAVWEDLKLIRDVGKFGHVAVVSDRGWVHGFSRIMDAIFSAEIRVFKLNDIEQARTWIHDASPQGS
ncbi:MAG: hypothetical protein NPIRA04_13770 [Nitrospirales bacterium]|nr:MAG: hypothetical protein NPIRA04_13770 [Nitrospirales bacterium]